MTAPTDIEERLAALEAREREVEKRERAASASGLRHHLYSRITCSVGVVDVIIAVCAVAILALTIVGAVMGEQ